MAERSESVSGLRLSHYRAGKEQHKRFLDFHLENGSIQSLACLIVFFESLGSGIALGDRVGGALDADGEQSASITHL